MHKQYDIEQDLYRGCHIKLLSVVDIPSFFQFIDQQERPPSKYRSIWIYINTSQHCQLLGKLTNQRGYTIHHAFNKEIVVFKWISQQQNKTVPFSLFWVAAGAVVIQDNKILQVEEKSGKRKGKYGLPGGRANKGQMISLAAQRQLFQQTGIRAKFKRLLFIRQSNQNQIYDCVDIYFICLMKIQQGGLDNFHLCENEIANFKWVPLEEYAQFTQKNSMGTQQLVSKHISKLYKQNTLFIQNQYFYHNDLVKGLSQYRL